MEPTNHPFRKENDLPNPHDYVPCYSSEAYFKNAHQKPAAKKKPPVVTSRNLRLKITSAGKINACNTSRFTLKYQWNHHRTDICSLPLEVFSLHVLVWGVHSIQVNKLQYPLLLFHFNPISHVMFRYSTFLEIIHTCHPQYVLAEHIAQWVPKNRSEKLLVWRRHDACIVHKASIYQL